MVRAARLALLAGPGNRPRTGAQTRQRGEQTAGDPAEPAPGPGIEATIVHGGLRGEKVPERYLQSTDRRLWG
jgi:hypothetical protein